MTLEARVLNLESRQQSNEIALRDLVTVVNGTHDLVAMILKKQEEQDKLFRQFALKQEEHDRRFHQIAQKQEEHDERFDQLELLIRQYFTQN